MPVKSVLFFLALFSISFITKAQKIDSIFFNLYTDSLKKQVHNYINIDGKLSNGTWLPLTEKDILFSASGGKFEGNSLILDSSFTDKKVTIKAVLKSNPAVWREVTIHIKTTADNERLKTMDEVLPPSNSTRKKKNFEEI
jgi:hypothetical protein